MSTKPPPEESDSLAELAESEGVDADMPPEPEPPEPPALEPPAPALASPASPAESAPPPEVAAPSPVPTPDAKGADAPQILKLTSGTYTLVRRLGRGGMAVVWLARNAGSADFERDFAIKQIRADHLADEECVEMYRRGFVDEAKLLAALQHPAIVQVYNLSKRQDAPDDANLYLVMEYVPGRTMREVLELAARKGRRLTSGFACYVAAQIADALEHAYNAPGRDGQALRIVHRDVNPTNIMVGPSGEVKLIDFGIAYSHVQGRDRTRTGVQKGKRTYASPEQLEETRELDNRSDLFVLGIVLAEMLTGRRPFDDGDERMETQIAMRILAAAPQDVKAITRDVPDELGKIIARLLAREPERRFHSAAEVAAALRLCIARTGAPFGPAEAMREVADLERASAEAAPASPSDATATQIAKREATRQRLKNPADPKPRILKPALLVVGIALAVQAVILVVLKMNHGGGSAAPSAPEIVKTPAQLRAEQEAHERALLPPASRPELPNVQDPNATLSAAAGLPVAPSAPAARPGSSAPASARPSAASRRRRLALHEHSDVAIDPRHRRDIDFPSTGFVSVSSGGSAALAKGTLIAARLTSPADPTNPGPVSATVTKDVAVHGAVVIPAGSSLSCSATGASAAARVGLNCDTVNVGGRSITMAAQALGQDQLSGIPVPSSGGSDGNSEPARNTGIDTAGRIADRVLGTDGIAGDLVNGAIGAGTETARRATAPGNATLQPAPRGTRFFLYVQSFGGP